MRKTREAALAISMAGALAAGGILASSQAQAAPGLKAGAEHRTTVLAAAKRGKGKHRGHRTNRSGKHHGRSKLHYYWGRPYRYGYYGHRYYGGYSHYGDYYGGPHYGWGNRHWRRHGYWSWHGGYGDHYARYRALAPPYIGSADDLSVDNQPGAGWAFLGTSRDAEALRWFAQRIQSDSDDALSKVGYALASAGVGELGRSVWAMRRALLLDPDVVHYAPLDPSARARIDEWIERFQPLPGYESGDMDDYFMLAVLHYLGDDLPEARRAVERAVQKADSSRSTANLRALIGAAEAAGLSPISPQP